MKIVLLNGGLANQAFQYIFYRFGELQFPKDEWYLDDTSFWIAKEHNGYELENVFDVHPNLLSRAFDEDVWDEIIALRKKGYSTPEILEQSGLKMDLLISECDVKYERPYQRPKIQLAANKFNPGIVSVEGLNVYYYGYWIIKQWFQSCIDVFRKEFSFPPIMEEKNLGYFDTIRNSNSIGIHIRRGDFVTLGWNLREDYYMNACKAMLEKNPKGQFFVFSDDIEWCKEHATACGLDLASHTTYVEGNVCGKNYMDMQLLSYCEHVIMSNSAFCYLAVLLGTNCKEVINPTGWEV